MDKNGELTIFVEPDVFRFFAEGAPLACKFSPVLTTVDGKAEELEVPGRKYITSRDAVFIFLLLFSFLHFIFEVCFLFFIF